MTQEPYRSARRVFWIVDGGPIHQGSVPATGSSRRVLGSRNHRIRTNPSCESGLRSRRLWATLVGEARAGT